MKIFRPKNINKRLTGTVVGASSTTRGGSPGNGNVIGPTKTPYCVLKCTPTLELGCRQFGGGGACCGGVFKINESFCGQEECCVTGPSNDCGGFYICCGPSTTKWFVAPSCTEVTRSWYSRADAVTVANSCVGSCGWFVPDCSQMKNPGYSCRTYWDSINTVNRYWSNTDFNVYTTFNFNMSNGNAYLAYGNGPAKGDGAKVRAFRCTV